MAAIGVEALALRCEAEARENRSEAGAEVERLLVEVCRAPDQERIELGAFSERQVEDELPPGVGGVLLHAQAYLPGGTRDLLPPADPAKAAASQLTELGAQ